MELLCLNLTRHVLTCFRQIAVGCKGFDLCMRSDDNKNMFDVSDAW